MVVEKCEGELSQKIASPSGQGHNPAESSITDAGPYVQAGKGPWTSFIRIDVVFIAVAAGKLRTSVLTATVVRDTARHRAGIRLGG